MNDVGIDDWAALWAGVSLDDVRRVVGVARRVLKVPTAMIHSSGRGSQTVRFPFGDHRFLPFDLRSAQLSGELDAVQIETDPALPILASLDAALTSAGREIGMLSVFDGSPRSWTEDDRATLRDLADCFAELLVLRHRSARLAPEVLVEASAPAEPATTAPESHGAEAHTAEAQGESAPDGAHILLADDLDLNRKLICDMLALEGHVVDSVPDGAAAVKAAGETKYDLILMDMIMPGMDGVAATRAIRALPSPACEVPIVALTAHSLPEQLESCIQAGMDATLVKPMTMDALTSMVAIWTRTRRKAA